MTRTILTVFVGAIVTLGLTLSASADFDAEAAGATAYESEFHQMVEDYNASQGISRWMEVAEIRRTSPYEVVAVADSCAGTFYFTFERLCSRSPWRIVEVDRGEDAPRP